MTHPVHSPPRQLEHILERVFATRPYGHKLAVLGVLNDGQVGLSEQARPEQCDAHHDKELEPTERELVAAGQGSGAAPTTALLRMLWLVTLSPNRNSHLGLHCLPSLCTVCLAWLLLWRRYPRPSLLLRPPRRRRSPRRVAAEPILPQEPDILPRPGQLVPAQLM